jgi:hypothetical protein
MEISLSIKMRSKTYQMQHSCLKALLSLVLLIMVTCCSAQDTAAVKGVLTADSLASGNTKDVLTSFFQLAFNRLTGPNKELDFNSNPFAVMLKSNPKLNIDTNYVRYTALRNTNFGFGLKLDSAYHFNGFSSGIKYALINKRDSSTSQRLFDEMRKDKFYAENALMNKKIVAYARTIADVAQRKKFIELANTFFKDDTAFSKLDTSFQRQIISLAEADRASFPHLLNLMLNKPSFSLSKAKANEQDSLNSLIRNDWLWTLGLSDTTYKDQFFFSNLVFNTEVIKGIGMSKPGSNFEFDFKSALNFLDDSLVRKRNLKRTLLSVEPGLNWVVRNRSTNQSWLEFQFSGSYSRNLTTLYGKEKRDSLTFNGTLRIRIINDIWIPLEIKYDPRSGNVFGFINVRFNFSALGGLASLNKSAAKKD